MNYIQCELEYRNPNKFIKTTAWIPEKFAKHGKILRIKYGNEWINGWKVANAFVGVKITEKEALMYRNTYRDQRDVSDI